MADKTIKVKVDVEADVQPTLAGLKELKRELKEISTTDPKFKEKQQEIDDYTDALNAAKTGAGNFADVLGGLPGPIGNIGNAVAGTVQSLKQFGSLKFSDIKGSFVELGKDVIDAGKGILNLTGITKLYTITTVAMSKALKFVGIEATAASFGVRAFSAALVASGIGAIVVALGFLISAFMNTGDEADTAATKIAKLNAELANTERLSKLRNAEEIARAKALGATETDIFNIRQKQRQTDLDNARKAYKEADVQLTSALVLYGKDSQGYKDAQKAKSDAAIKIDQLKSEILVADYEQEERLRNQSVENAAKASQTIQRQNEKDAADKKKTLDEITKNEKEAALSLLDEREQQRRKIVNNYNEQIKLAAANGKDTVILEEAKLNALRILNDKFAKDDADKKKEALDREKDFWNKAKDAATEKREKTYQDGLKALDREVTFIGLRNETLLQGTKSYFQGRLELINAQEKRELADKELTEAEKLAIESKYQKLRDNLKKEERASNAMAVAATLDSLAKVGSALASSLDEEAKTSKAAFEKRKKIQKATAIMSAASGIIQILAQPSTLPSPADWIVKGLNAIALGVSTGIQIKNIDRVQFEGGGGSSTPSAPMPKYNASNTMSMPQIQLGQGINPSQQISETLTVSQRPVRAYVVSQDISSAQALDRRTNVAATFSAG